MKLERDNNTALIDWEEYTLGIYDCLKRITLVDVVFAPSRGGLIPGVLASHYFKCPLSEITFRQRINLWMPQGKTVLLIDDVSDSGGTLIKCLKPLENNYEKVITCTIAIKLDTKKLPDIHYFEVEPQYWVKFPYEQD